MKKFALLIAMLSLALFSACGGEQAEEPAGDTQGEDVPEVETAEVVITNGLESWNIHSILIDPSDEAWGENRLEAGDILEADESFTVEIEPGTWDIMLTDEDGDTYTLWQVEIGAEGYEWYVTLDDLDTGWEDDSMEPQYFETGEGDAYVSIVNDLGGWVIYYVYVDPTESDSWGEDRLGAEILDQDDELRVFVEPGMYDIQVVDEDGDTYTLWEVELDEAGYDWFVTMDDLDMYEDVMDEGGMALETGEGTAPVTIYNELGGWDIYYAYVDASDSPWGDDRLGADILTGECSITVWVDPGTYDMKVEDEDGDTYTLWGVDVPEEGYEWHVTLADMD